ncbi:hypothetical protein G7068_15935 [Leucobacter viscericola]|uniref:Uncharacterized protein n=1 Tax=Leucobacter viscericola TaxID=2714935 RepID=A0A6G7XJ72_9MICO|nr:hypothetical protein [Leucobacter viscericola]QIK64536.1 hypothetical protein G7068_15935 [Leucobacter viscericola]
MARKFIPKDPAVVFSAQGKLDVFQVEKVSDFRSDGYYVTSVESGLVLHKFDTYEEAEQEAKMHANPPTEPEAAKAWYRAHHGPDLVSA